MRRFNQEASHHTATLSGNTTRPIHLTALVAFRRERKEMYSGDRILPTLHKMKIYGPRGKYPCGSGENRSV